MDTQLPFPKKGEQPPIFGPCLLWPNGWMDQDAIGTKVSLAPGRIVLHEDQAPRPKSGTDRQFSARVYCAQTVAHLSYW